MTIGIRNYKMRMNVIDGEIMNTRSKSRDIPNNDLHWQYGIGKQSKRAKKLDRHWGKSGVTNINCHEKRCYSTYIDAQIASDFHNFRIVLMEFPIVPYHCSIHDTWHIGHDRKLNEYEADDYLWKSLARTKRWLSLGISSELLITF